MPCPHSDCAACPESGSCGALFLTEDELSVLRRFAETPFLPLVKMTDGLPLCPTLEGDAQRLAAVLRNLESKGLISLDEWLPLMNFDYSAWVSFPIHGSMALTASGQDVLEALEVQGIGE